MMAVILAGSTCLAQGGEGRLSIPDYFRQARQEKGLVPAVLLSTDYFTRNTRIGSSQRHQADDVLVLGDNARAALPVFSGRPSRHVSEDYDFVGYLIGNGMNQDAVTLLTRGPYHASDTLHYLRGWAEYSGQYLDAATAAFDLVPKGSPFYDKSLFFDVVSNAHLGRYGRSAELLRGYDGPYKELKCLEEAGIALLEGRAGDYITAAAGFTYSQYALTESERQLQGIYNERYYGPVKNPALAAAASAVVPGLGKVYAGRLAEGVSSFLAVGTLAAITAENWARHGFTNWKTLLSGAVGAMFYIGNIYGSYVSVSIQNNELKDVQDTAILYHIHIPLRSVFQ